LRRPAPNLPKPLAAAHAGFAGAAKRDPAAPLERPHAVTASKTIAGCTMGDALASAAPALACTAALHPADAESEPAAAGLF
jgi:hypothetical protein